MSAHRPVSQWLRAIADCSVLRVGFDDEALIEAIDLGLVDPEPVEGNDDALDCRLTGRGSAALANQVTPKKMAA